jgi:hypothetical protein
MSGVFVLRAAPGKSIARGGIELPFPLLAPSVIAGAHMAFPELRADRPYQQPADDSYP